MTTDPAHVAAAVFDCLRNGRQIPSFTGSDPDFGPDAAYAVTADLRRLRQAAGERPAGRKIGFTNRTIWDEYGVFAPIWGDIYDTTVHSTDAKAQGVLSLAGLCEPRIEPEIVFGLKAPVRPGMDDASLLAAIDWIAHGFEIVQSIYPDWRFTIADTIACGGLHGRMIVGPRTPVSGFGAGELAAALSAFSIDLYRDGACIDSGSGSNVLDSPLNALRHLADVLAGDSRNPALAAGEIVTTGTLTRAFPVAAGQTWTTRLHGLYLPGLSVTFA